MSVICNQRSKIYCSFQLYRQCMSNMRFAFLDPDLREELTARKKICERAIGKHGLNYDPPEPKPVPQTLLSS